MDRWCLFDRPENLEYVLKTNFANYPKGRSFTYPSHDLLGQGIFNTDHELWKSQRKTASLEFSTRTLRDLMVKSNRSSVQQRLLPVLDQVATSRLVRNGITLNSLIFMDFT